FIDVLKFEPKDPQRKKLLLTLIKGHLIEQAYYWKHPEVVRDLASIEEEVAQWKSKGGIETPEFKTYLRCAVAYWFHTMVPGQREFYRFLLSQGVTGQAILDLIREVEGPLMKP